MILGIDPGLSGAMALYDPLKNSVTTYDMPTFEIRVNGKLRRQVDLRKLQVMFNTFELVATHVILENPRPLPGPKISSMAHYGLGFVCGVLQMASTAIGVPMTLVPPATWKAAMRLTSDKDECRKRASQLFPASAHQWERKKDDGRAESALLAYYHWQRSGGR